MAGSTTCFLGLGSNLSHGDMTPLEVLRDAVSRLSESIVENVRQSTVYRTSPVHQADQPDYYNCVLMGDTTLQPGQLLDACLGVENAYGRMRSNRWGARTLDIDVLAFNDLVLPGREAWQEAAAMTADGTVRTDLILPHPRLHERAFVLVPLVDVAAEWRHPVFGQSARQLFELLPQHDRRGVRPISAE